MSKKSEELIRKTRRAQQDKNRRFKAMPPAEQRMQIAKDVITYLKMGKIKAKTGRYLRLDEYIEKSMDFMQEFDPTQDVRELEPKQRLKYVHDLTRYTELMDKQVCDIASESTSCNVCGIGAVFIAAVHRADKLKLGEYTNEESSFGRAANNDDKMREYLDQWFNSDQRALIEQAFEKGISMNESCHGVGWETMDDAAQFGKRFKKSDDRLIAIMQNIIDNGGEFNPHVE